MFSSILLKQQATAATAAVAILVVWLGEYPLNLGAETGNAGAARPGVA